jgi:hypothetical protein
MHLAVKVVGEAAIVVEARQVGAADVADLQLLVARGPAGVGQGLELALLVALGLHGLLDAEELLVGARDLGGFAQDFDFEQARLDGLGEVGDLFQL